MRFIIGILFMAVIIGACTWSGVPVARQTLGGEIAQVDITPRVAQLEDGFIQIVAEIGVSTCGVDGNGDGNICDQNEILCDSSGNRGCSDCTIDNSCELEWVVYQRNNGLNRYTADDPLCVKTSAHYEMARSSSFCVTEVETENGETEAEDGEEPRCPDGIECMCYGASESFCIPSEEECADHSDRCQPSCEEQGLIECPDTGGYCASSIEYCPI
jgi:hypothetical protein